MDNVFTALSRNLHVWFFALITTATGACALQACILQCNYLSARPDCPGTFVHILIQIIFLGFDQFTESQYIGSIIKVNVSEILPQESIHYRNGDTANKIPVVVTDDVGIQAKLNFWDEHLIMTNLFEAGDSLYIKRCFFTPDDHESFVLEYGPETTIFCLPLACKEEMLPSQKDGLKLLHMPRDNKGMLDCSMYPERLRISEIKQNMTNITLAGCVLLIGVRKLVQGKGVDMVTYQIQVQDDTGTCTVTVTEVYKYATILYCGQFVLIKNLHVSSRFYK